MAEESIILTIGEGEQIENSPSSTTKQDMPDDSLDAYIYIEEHPEEYSNISAEIARPGEEDSIEKGSENRQEPSKNTSHSVFAANNSRIFHQRDCSELGTGDLLEFDSAEEALVSGGVACERCNP